MKNFIKENNKYIKFLTVLFAFSFLFGFLLGDRFPKTIENIISQLNTINISNNFFSEFTFIFFHNFSIVILIILLHILLFVPIFVLVYNGFITGAILRYFYMQKGSIVFLQILPHGIFEIAGIILASAFALKLSIKFLDFITRQKTKSYVNFIKNNYKVLYYILGLFLIAAMIETVLIMII